MCEAAGLTTIGMNADLSPTCSSISKEDSRSHHSHSQSHNNHKPTRHNETSLSIPKQNQVGTVMLFGVPIVSLVMDGKERLCLAQISSTLLKEFSYNEIHNRRVALGITCIQCTPVQLEILRRAGAMPVTSRRCGMITRREAERLCQSFLGDHAPPQLPENFAFDVYHECAWGCRGAFVPSRYNSSRAKCIRCSFCQLFFSPNKFIFHSHRLPDSRYVQPDAANFNSWRRHLKLCGDPPEEVSPSSSPIHFPKTPIKEQRSNEILLPNSSNAVSNMATAQIVHAWEDVKAMFNGGTRKRLLAAHSIPTPHVRRNNSSNNGGKHSSANSSTGGNSHAGRSLTPQSSRNNNHAHSPGGGGGGGSGGGAHPSNNFTPESSVTSPPNSNFLSVAPPLLSPGSRLVDNIWNPGVSNASPSSRQCHPIPPIPFHPLSIPWLRRPLFPFSHPFGPTCKLLSEPTISENLAANLNVRPNHSAFKPVSRNAEHFFSWLNNNTISNTANILAGNAGGALGGTVTTTTLPEDLSLNSGGNSISSNPSPPSLSLSHHQSDLIDSSSPPGGLTTSLTSSNEDSNDCRPIVVGGGKNSSSKNNHNNNHNNNNSSRLLSPIQNDSDDEENVDIESTEAEECSSTSSVWMTNSLSDSKQLSSDSHKLFHTHHHHHHHQHSNNSSNNQHNIRKRSYDSGAEDDIDEDTSTVHSLSSSGTLSHINGGRRKKRMWDCDRRLATAEDHDDDRETPHDLNI